MQLPDNIVLKLVDHIPICSSFLSHFISSFWEWLESLLISGGLIYILRLFDMYLNLKNGKEPMFRASVRLQCHLPSLANLSPPRSRAEATGCLHFLWGALWGTRAEEREKEKHEVSFNSYLTPGYKHYNITYFLWVLSEISTRETLNNFLRWKLNELLIWTFLKNIVNC